MHKLKVIGKLQYPALNKDLVPQTPQKSRLEQPHWVLSPTDLSADDSNLQKLSSVLKLLSQNWCRLRI